MKKCFWVFLVILFFSFTFAAAGEQPNFDGTVGLVVKGDSRLTPMVQQTLQMVLRDRGYNIVILNYRSDSPYRLLDVEVNWRYGQTSSSNVRIGNYTTYATIHHDSVIVTITLFPHGGYSAIPLSTGASVISVTWSEGGNSYSGNNWNNSGQNSGEEKLKKAAVVVALEALSQIQLSPPAPVQKHVDLNFDLSSFIEMARDRGEKLYLAIDVKDGWVFLKIKARENDTHVRKFGVGRTLDEAFRDLMTK